jgi:dienelactone hydrolase
MNRPTTFQILLGLSIVILCSCNNHPSEEKKAGVTTAVPQLKEDNISYSADTVTMNGYVVYADSTTEKRPAVLVVHEWWGLNDYAKKRARQLTELGYIAMAVDMFGNGRTADNPDQAMALAMPFYQNPQLAKTRLDAALAKLKSYPQTDTSRIAAIGYCYGGYSVLNAAKLGADLNGVVVFHGNLGGAPPIRPMKAEVLVCNGGDDKLVPEQEINSFKKQMDSVGRSYTFKSYPGALHSFTNSLASENGKKFNMPLAYNAEADKNSWNDMKEFLHRIFSK